MSQRRKYEHRSAAEQRAADGSYIRPSRRKYEPGSVVAKQVRALQNLRRGASSSVHRAMERAGVKRWQSGQPDRYLIWVQWARSLYVSTEELVFRLVTSYRSESGMSGRPNLGFSLASLTGPKARERAEREIGERTLDRPALSGIGSDPMEYRDRVSKTRSKKASRKAWRGSTAWSGAMICRLRETETDAVRREWESGILFAGLDRGQE